MKAKISIILSIIILGIILTACLTYRPAEPMEWRNILSTPTQSSELVKIRADVIESEYHSVYESVYESVYPAPVVTPLPYP